MSYADELAHQKASIDRQEVMLARLWTNSCLIKSNLPSTIGAEDSRALARQRPTTGGRPCPTINGLDYSQGCFELKKEEQSRATDWGLIGVQLWSRLIIFKRLFTSARPKEIKANDGIVDDGMVIYMESSLKIKFEGFEDQEQVSKPCPTVAGRLLSAFSLKVANLQRTVDLSLPPLELEFYGKQRLDMKQGSRSLPGMKRGRNGRNQMKFYGTLLPVKKQKPTLEGKPRLTTCGKLLHQDRLGSNVGSGQSYCKFKSHGAEEGAFRGTKTLLFSKLQVEEAKETSLEELGATKAKESSPRPTTDGRSTILSLKGFWFKAVLRIDLPPTIS
ncbi:hypothetical protein M9H77_02711 [Catharanthus roseus]|uniref:Uncharacterized protein n=1 Tax=Catharanthus roseus TaxID=4058 RepID=A0ACC0C9K8_CATRO|nr:hypothetical protein M9H77_02711 [Catharanthus roseus]